MLQVHVTSSDVLARLIRSTQNEATQNEPDPKIAVQVRLIRETQAQAAQARPSWQTLDTVDFQRLEPENDWTDV